MKNSHKGQIKKVLVGASVGVMALLSVALNQSIAADNTQTNTPATTTTTAPATTNAPDASSTTIDGIMVSDTPNKDGYVLQGKDKLPTNSAKIYATVQLGHGIEGSKVMATLTHIDSGATIGPVIATIDTTGDTVEAFSFTNTSMPWLKGQYKIDVSISNGASKSVTFTVGD